jgi:hypothetical protein
MHESVILPLGSVVPFLVRPSSSVADTYELVGESFVYGVMNGEAFNLKGVRIDEVYLS